MSLNEKQVALIKGMLDRGDYLQDIAAYFGENGARIAEIKKGDKFGDVAAAASDALPPQHRHRSFAPEIDPEAPLETQVEVLKQLIVTTPPLSPIKLYTISPELADWVLKNLHRVLGHGNRSQRRAKIAKMISAIHRGFFTVTADTIKFGAFELHEVEAGMGMLDGQNRLAAIAEGGRPVASYVAFGVDRDAFRHMDIGAGRTGGDTFKIYGEVHADKIAGATRWLKILDDWHAPAPPDRGLSFTNEELWEHFKKLDRDRLREVVREATTASDKALPINPLAALFYRFKRRDPDCSKHFIYDLQQQTRGAGALIRYAKDLKRQAASRVHENVYVAAIILAWNQYRAGNTRINARTQLRWDPSKDFPEIT